MPYQKHRPCSVCKHPERHRIEVLRLGGIPVDRIIETYSTLRRDAVYRHMANHVSNETKAAIVADIPLSDLAKRAADEGRSLIDYFAITRSTVMQSMQMAASVNDYTGTAALAKRAVEVNKEIGRLTGEMLNSAPVQHVTNNTVFMASPAFMQLEACVGPARGPQAEPSP